MSKLQLVWTHAKIFNKSKAAGAPMVDTQGKPYQLEVSAVEASNLLPAQISTQLPSFN